MHILPEPLLPDPMIQRLEDEGWEHNWIIIRGVGQLEQFVCLAIECIILIDVMRVVW